MLFGTKRTEGYALLSFPKARHLFSVLVKREFDFHRSFSEAWSNMEISATEIDILCRRINETVSGYSLSGLYSIDGGVLLRLRHETRQELLIAISSFATWLTSKNLALPQAEPFVTDVREKIERSRLTNVAQAGGERIAEFSFESRSGEKVSLFAEFFAGGNLVLADERRIIIGAEKSQRFRHRSIIAGENYELPPSRGMSLKDLTKESLHSFVDSSLKKQEGGLTLVKWFGRNVGTSRKFVEEIFHESGVNPDTTLASISENEIDLLAKTTRNLKERLESSNKGYLLLPTEGQEEYQAVDVCSIVPSQWKELVDKGKATIQEFPTLSEALDEAQVQALVLDRRSKASKEIRTKTAELDSAISKQDALIEKNKMDSQELRKIASELMQSFGTGSDESLAKKLEDLAVLERDATSGGSLRFVNEPRAFFSSFSTSGAIASRLFDEAKRLEANNENISRIRKDLFERKQALLDQTRVSEERAARRMALERRAREWFERYRWFFTSDLHLAVGGRDSTSNSIVINKYTEQGDVIFHADLHGSPFFILKAKGIQNGELDAETEFELAQATVSFSRAWKDELGSADAYWVRPDQIKKSAPSGEYLPRGSFFIEGKKNFVKHVKVELSVGVMSSEKLLREEGKPVTNSSEKIVQLVVICGPEKSLSVYCLAMVKIAPGKEKSSAIARRIKQMLVGRVKDESLREGVKKMSIDEFMRVLPSGTYKVVSEKQNG